MITAAAIFSKLAHFNHDAPTTMAAMLVAMVLLAYWILKT